jgi:hypothetical protein
VLKLSVDSGDILLINAYLPYFNTRDLANQKALYQETLAYIENIMINHPFSKFVLLLDMNCNPYIANHPYSILVRDLMSKFSLVNSI